MTELFSTGYRHKRAGRLVNLFNQHMKNDFFLSFLYIHTHRSTVAEVKEEEKVLALVEAITSL